MIGSIAAVVASVIVLSVAEKSALGGGRGELRR